jgi:alpha-glucosidase
MIQFLRDVLETAAANHLTVTFHGVCKPTGLERTFPNLLSSEGAMNYEYDKWDPIGIPPEHDLTLVFTRMLAGPMDFHQGSLRGVPVEQYKPNHEPPLVMGTPCRMLATYVVFENHLSMVADYPSAYRGNPGTSLIAQVPTTWDETKVLQSQVGQLAVVARRSASDWWIGAMGGRNAAGIKVPLKFLGTGGFTAQITHDDLKAEYRIATESKLVSKSDVLDLRLAPAGGAVIHVSPDTR